jgi:small subunit ribosomal protein S8e
MVVLTKRSERKSTGGRYKALRVRKVKNMGRRPTLTKLEDRRTKTIRTKGSNKKKRLLSTNIANVYDPSSKKYQKVKIKNITENPANRHMVRRNIMTKGAVIETELGKAKIKSRPGQSGTINAVLIK